MTVKMECFQPCTKDQLRNSIYGEFNATEESADRDANYLIEWMSQQPHLPNVRDKDILITFLLRGKFQLERTKKSIERYYTARARMPEIFQNRNVYDKAESRVLKVSPYTPTPKLTPEGYRVIMLKIFEHTEQDMFTEENLLRTHQMATDVNLKFDRNKGLIIVMDLKNLSLVYVKLIMTAAKKLLELFNNITPLRLRKVYLLNFPSYGEAMLRLFKLLMKKKLADRIELWNGSDEELATVIPKECLPIEYGGTDMSLKEMFDVWIKSFYTAQDWFASEENMIANLSKIPVSQNCYEHYEFGVEGSFKKISLD